MRAIRLVGHIGEDHMLHLELPVDVNTGPAEVIVLLADTPMKSENDLEDFLDALTRQTRYQKNQDEIDRSLKAVFLQN